jgi:hypothetical protein
MNIERGFAPPQWEKTSLAGQVSELERQIDKLRDIAGSAVSTMKVNRERGTLKIDDPKQAKLFDGWVETWIKRLNECSNNDLSGADSSSRYTGINKEIR